MEYRIASFNMRRFGFGAKKDLDKISEIISEEDFDIVALQEIWSEGKGIKRLLSESMRYDLRDWDFCFEEPRESIDAIKRSDMIANDRRGEGYAYLWNKKRFKLVETVKIGKKEIFSPRIINSLSRDVNADCSFFARTPYYIRLQPLYGGFFEFRLINIHIYHGLSGDKTSIDKRKKEFEFLTQEIYPEICKRRYGNFRVAYTIAMGDYNLNIFSPLTETREKNAYVSNIYTYSEGRKDIHVLTVQDGLTTLKSINENDISKNSGNNYGYANNYDHFTYSPELSQFISVKYNTIDVINKYCNGDFEYYQKNISDHIPIVMTVEI